MLFNSIKNYRIIVVIICFIVSCTDINEVYNKKFNLLSFYEDLTIIENSKLLTIQDVLLLKLYIDNKILNDSVVWLKTHSYKELFYFAVENTKNNNSNSVMDLSWKTNNSIHISIDTINFDKGCLHLKIQNKSNKDILYFRALMKFENGMRKTIGQSDIIYKDTLVKGSVGYFDIYDKVVYNLNGIIGEDFIAIPIIRKIKFSDSTEFINPLSSYFE